jgi:hypothetical protein
MLQNYEKKLKNDIELTLNIMNSSDFHHQNGLNESGFKGIVISSLIKLNNKYLNRFIKKKHDRVFFDQSYSICSEYKVDIIKNNNKNGYGFIDIIFFNEDKSYIDIYELKYVRLKYIKDKLIKKDIKINYKAINPLHVRKCLNELLKNLNEYTDNKNNKITELEISTFKSNQLSIIDKNISDISNEAINQALNYNNKFFEKYQKLHTINFFSIIGVGNKVHINKKILRIKNRYIKNKSIELLKLAIPIFILLILLFISYLIYQ